MNSILRFVALAMFLGLALSAATGTFSSTTESSSNVASAEHLTNGYQVTLTGPGWIYGDTLTLAASGTSITHITPTFVGLTGIGLLVTGGATGCTTAPTATTTGYTTTSLVSKSTVGCPADFATLYSGAPAAPTSDTAGNLAFSAAAPITALTSGTAVTYTVTAPSSKVATNCNGISVTVGASTAATAPAGVCATQANANQFAISTQTYAFYVQTAGTATVCFQTATQFTNDASNCGEPITTTSSAGIVSASITGFVATIALIFFN